MVSLGRSPHRPAGGGFSFSHDSSVNVDDDDIRILQPVLGDDVEEHERFHPLCTVPVVLFELIFTIMFGGLAVVMAVVWPEERERCEPFYLLLYMQAGFWVIVMGIHLFLRSKHQRLRAVGYLDFYLDMLILYRMPAYVTCLCNVMLLVVSTLMQQLYRELEAQCQPPTRLFTPVTYLCAVVVTEAIVLVPCLITYMIRVRRFNRVKPPPDVQREEWLASFVDDSYRRGEVGFRENVPPAEELLERQSDLIRYLREHNAHLGLKILQLSATLNGDQE